MPRNHALDEDKPEGLGLGNQRPVATGADRHVHRALTILIVVLCPGLSLFAVVTGIYTVWPVEDPWGDVSFILTIGTAILAPSLGLVGWILHRYGMAALAFIALIVAEMARLLISSNASLAYHGVVAILALGATVAALQLRFRRMKPL